MNEIFFPAITQGELFGLLIIVILLLISRTEE